MTDREVCSVEHRGSPLGAPESGEEAQRARRADLRSSGLMPGSTTHGALAQRVVLAASLWVAASLALALTTFWWQAGQVGGLAGFNVVLLLPGAGFAAISFGLRTLRWHFFLVAAGAELPLL